MTNLDIVVILKPMSVEIDISYNIQASFSDHARVCLWILMKFTRESKTEEMKKKLPELREFMFG